jgi:ribosomal protein L11 methylase PrmA
MQKLFKAFQQLAPTKRFSCLHDIYVVTDQDSYLALDQVFPMHAEQQFFLDELNREKMVGAQALEIGLGSGVLSIGAAKAGAACVTALEINPRAKNYAGFNIMLNGVEDRVAIIDGDRRRQGWTISTIQTLDSMAWIFWRRSSRGWMNI